MADENKVDKGFNAEPKPFMGRKPARMDAKTDDTIMGRKPAKGFDVEPKPPMRLPERKGRKSSRGSSR